VSHVYIYIFTIYILSHRPNFCRSSSTRTRALTRTYMYIVAWWQAGEHTGGSDTLTTHTRAQRSYEVPPTRLDDEGILVLSCFSNDAQFMYDFFASLFHRQLRWGGTLSFHFLRNHSRCCCSCCVEKVEAYLGLLYSTGYGYEVYLFDRCLFPDLFYRWLWFIIILPIRT